MRVLLWILGIVAVLFISAYTILFTGFGNSLIKPYVEKIATQKSGMKIELKKFKVGFSKADIEAAINSELNLTVSGNYNLFKKDFDLNYTAQTKSLNSFGIDIKDNISLNGDMTGNLNNFIVNGAGVLVGSNMRFAIRILNLKPLEIKLDAKSINLAQISSIAFHKPYIIGHLDATADISYIDNGYQGNANLDIKKANTNNELIQNDFGISFPNNFFITAKSDIKLSGDIATAKTVIKSPIAVAAALNSIYNISDNKLNTDLNLNIPDLLKLEPLIKQSLKGEITLNANTQIEANKLSFLDAQIKGLGGIVIAKLKDNKIDADIKNIKLDELLKIASLPAIANGSINGIASINDINIPSKTNGSANLKITNSKLKSNELNKLINTEIKKDIPFTGDAKAIFQDGILNLNSILSSEILRVDKFNSIYNLDSKDANASLQMSIPSLSALGNLTGKTLNGSVELNAEATTKTGKLDNLNLNIKAMDGVINANLKNNALKANIKDVLAENLFVLIGQKPLFNGILNAELNLDSIDLKNLNGKGVINLNNSTLNATNLKEITKKDFPNNIKFSAEFRPTFTNSIAYFMSNLSSNLINIDKFEGSFDINKLALDATYLANINDLSKFEFLIGKKLIGSLNANGKVQYKDTLYLTLNSDLLKSKLKSEFKDSILTLNLDKFSVQELLMMADYDPFYEGISNLNAKYDLSKAKGDFKIDLLEGKLAKSGLTNAISIALNQDISEEVFKNGYVKGDINKDIITFNAQMSSPKSDVNVTKGSINMLNSKIFIPIDTNIEKTDLQIEVSGTTKEPKYAFKSSYLKTKIEKEMNRGLKKLFNSDENKTNDAKDIVKGLKNLF
ncbi:hypothetical protein [Campylobacter fetus]|uniref:Periplasmic protein n=1 Tax=Campylobacter fetus subsp. testudinum TaxID=1507806 RepID=A0AAX0HCR8_CAMFE|nr:hypothetical protein [Campylobacter fetus]ALV64717.2 hypothetical protein CFTSP3_0748 [Campylobacter fetus subsp. testudinum Sp3]OCR91165.1 hypothetical protein CFT12S02225_04070 [Campylobacter fetus subsp. testudinum]OCR98780.1 hypothetical protein CFT12S02855_00940 [Campylobacter fetus subsp. testudinum]OCS01447.1 hypothetical protein A9K75_01310 [Campylobacter fetus subsp. testudinum]OCS02102.1 hypothetical protein CFT85387_00125 [Campylobacter fetus subsp. testudinum]